MAEIHVIEGIDGQVEYDGTTVTAVTAAGSESFPASEVTSVDWKRATAQAPGALIVRRGDTALAPIAFSAAQEPRMGWLRERLDTSVVPGSSVPVGSAVIAGAAVGAAVGKKNWFLRHKVLSAVAALVVLIIIIVAASSGGSSKKNSTAAVGDSAAPATSAPANGKATLLQTSGTGTKDTASFTAKGDWDIAYTYDCSSFLGGSGNFIVAVKGSDSNLSLANQGVNTLGAKGADVSHEHHGGTYYLSVLSECPWTVTVTG